MGSDDVRGAHMAIFQNLRPEGARIGELTERPSTPACRSATWWTTSKNTATGNAAGPRNRRATLVCCTGRGWHKAGACARMPSHMMNVPKRDRWHQ